MSNASGRLVFTLLAILALACASVAGASEPAESSAQATLRIVIVGGTGTIGQRIVREALERGHHLTLVARDPATVTEKHERLAVIQGNVLDASGVAALAKGKDVLISATGVARDRDPDYSFYRRAAESLVAAMRSLGSDAPRLLVVGGVGSLQRTDGTPVIDNVPADRKPEHLGQKAALDYYRGVADVKWTYLSPPGRIAPGERTGKYRLGKDQLVVDDQGESRISMEDYAVAMIDEAENPRHVGQRFTVGY